MAVFEKIILVFTYLAIGIALIEVYLKINKIWKRKHDKQVAESQSVVALGLSVMVMLVWSANFIVKKDFEAISDNLIYLMESLVLIVIGSGFFVQAKRDSKKGLWRLIIDAIKQERGEASYLFKMMTGKGQAEQIITLLKQLAWVDGELAADEVKKIKEFADKTGVKINLKDFENEESNPHSKNESSDVRYVRIQETLKSYLLTQNPNREEALQLKQLLYEIINADGIIEEEEDRIIGELDGIILTHIKDPVPKFYVIVVPQQDEHRQKIEDTITRLNPDISLDEKKKDVDGGFGFVVAECYSQTFADYKAQQERENHHIMTVVRMEMQYPAKEITLD